MKISNLFGKKQDADPGHDPEKKISQPPHSPQQKSDPPQEDNKKTSNAEDPPPSAPSSQHHPDTDPAPTSEKTDIKAGMEKSRGGFIARMDSLLTFKKEIDAELIDELEEILVMADMGVATVQDIFDRLRSEVKRKELKDPAALRQRIKSYIREMLELPHAKTLDQQMASVSGPFVILVVGVNGVGKTTTIAKMAYNFKQQGKKVLIAAADTFRAAAIDQLQEWGRRLDVPVIHHQPGSDPSAVAFDAVVAGISRGVDVVIVDTAGRLHTQVNLMEELKKIRRVIGKKLPEAPHEVLLVLDATTGQNAVSQARLFRKATDITGIALTKLDGTAKGGIAAGIVHEMQIPIHFIGIGEKMDDLRPFNAEEFVDALFA